MFQQVWETDTDLSTSEFKDVPIPALREVAATSEYQAALTGEAEITACWTKTSDDAALYWLSPAVFDDGSLGIIISLRKKE